MLNTAKTHRSEKDKQHMSLFEKFVTEGNANADEVAKDGAMLDGGEVAQIRASTVQQRREEVCAVLQYAASFHCLVYEWHDCEELEVEAARKVITVGQKKEKLRDIARNGVRPPANTVV